MSLDVDPGKFGEQRDPQMERRVLLLMAVAFLVLVSWQGFMTRRYPPKSPAERPMAPAGPAPSLGHADVEPPPAVTPAPEEPQAVPAYEPVAETEARTAVVMTDTFEATFTNRGARLRSLKLRKYAETLPAHGEPPRPLESIPREAIERGLLPLSVEVEGRPELGAALDAALFQLDTPRLDLGADGEGTLSFHHRTPDGIDVEKRISFRGGSYLMHVDVRVKQLARRGADGVTIPQEALPARLTWGPGFSNPPGDLLSREGGMSSYDYFGRAIYHTDRKTYRTAKGSVESPLQLPGQVSWAGLEERYFALVFIPKERLRSVTFEPVAVSADGKERKELRLSVGLDGPVGVFVGPKEYEVLQATHATMPDVIEFGSWFGWLAKGMLLVLKRLEAQTGNYGVAIVLLTLLIKLVLFPLTLTSYRSMKRMQKLQPKMNAIREKYKRLPSDAAERREQKMKMNEEIMGLYKKEGVNPVGGCFPLLLQMPFLFAFYSLLSVAIELRHAPFFFWIHDLSQRDPIYITPVLMTLAQFVSQKLTPISSPDPVQQRMMTYMPLFFLFIFVNVPSGLVIYWLTSNLFQIGQQLTLNRLERRTLAPARS